MGNSASQSQRSTQPNSASVNVSSMPINVYPNTDIAKNLDEASKLLSKYKDNNLGELINSIREDKDLQRQLGINLTNPDDPIMKLVNEFNKKFESFDKNGTNLNEILKGTNFYNNLKAVEENDLKAVKDKVLSSPLLLNNKSESDSVETIFKNIAIMRSKEQYFKYEYLLTQIWIISYLNKINSSVLEFTQKTIELVKKNEEQRNEYTKQMLHTLLSVIVHTEEDLNEKQFDAFKKAMTTLELNTKASADNLAKELNQNRIKMNDANQPVTVTPGSSGGRRKQKGGFVRDFSRFPQPFYELSST
jgi:hypothetical protein